MNFLMDEFTFFVIIINGSIVWSGECREQKKHYIKQAIYVIVVVTGKKLFLSLFMYAVVRQKTRI